MTGLLLAVALAGEPPQIPWDTCWVEDTVLVDDQVRVSRWPILFITQDKYEAEVLGLQTKVSTRKLRSDLEAVKMLLRSKEKK